jgi:hypothetical protein
LSNVLKILWIIAKRGGQINKVQNKGWTECDFEEFFSIYALIVYNLEETWDYNLAIQVEKLIGLLLFL